MEMNQVIKFLGYTFIPKAVNSITTLNSFFIILHIQSKFAVLYIIFNFPQHSKKIIQTEKRVWRKKWNIIIWFAALKHIPASVHGAGVLEWFDQSLALKSLGWCLMWTKFIWLLNHLSLSLSWLFENILFLINVNSKLIVSWL